MDRMTPNRIEQAGSALVVSTARTSRSCAEAARDGRLIRVFRQVFVRVEYLQGIDRWEFARRVNAVRALAVGIVLGPRAVVSHDSAIALAGIDQRAEFVDVHVSIPTKWGSGRSELDEIRGPGGRRAPRRRLVRHLARVPAEHVRHLGDLRVCDMALAAVQCAGSLSARDGVVVVSAALRALSDFERVDQAEGRRREDEWRRRLQALLEQTARGLRHCRRARAVLAAADAACESVAERILLWILRSRGFRVQTQVRYRVDGAVFRVDFLIRGGPGRPDVAIEFDGRGKYGDLPQAILFTVGQEKRRQMALESLGLVFLRLDWDDLRDPDQIGRVVARRCGRAHLPRARGRLLV